MMLYARNALALAVVMIAAAACGMMEDKSTTTASNNDWFQYAYYSSTVNFDHEVDAAKTVKPLRLQ